MNYTFSPCQHCHTLNKLNSSKALRSTPVCGKCGKELKLDGLVSQVSALELKKIIQKSDIPVIVDFWAAWCGPCQMYAPEFKKASVEIDAVFLKVNTEIEPHLSAELGIRGIPCTLVFKAGKEVCRQSGAMSSEQIKKLI